MKTIKLVVFFTMLSAVFYTSCSDNESIENQAITQDSAALRVMINDMKRTNNVAGRMAINNESMPFDFVYPINVSFNNGTVITVTSLEGLIDLLTNESSELFISGIEFPFQIVVGLDNTVITIDGESDFWEVIEDLDIVTYDDYVFSPFCFELTFPISFVTDNEQVITVASQEALYDLFMDPNQSTIVYDFVYPFNVIVDNQIVVVNNMYEFDELSFNCNEGFDCVCEEIYDPVCVSYGNGTVVEYPNACFANCDGFNESDFVSCDTNNSIYDFLGTCYNIEYPIQMMVVGEVVTVTNDSQLLEYLIELPNDAFIVFPINVTLIQSGTTFLVLDQNIMPELLEDICN
uniref:Kazal-type serine protease inhibitor family protein n=1 Tax=Flavobacterium sp. TaxID=239 RepID=UPI00404B7753